MSLLQIEEFFSPHVDSQSNVVRYSAKMQKIGNIEVDRAVLAANINILRRSLPFAYLFVDSYYTFQEWLDDEFGDNSDHEYVSTFNSTILKQSIALYDPCLRAVKGNKVSPTVIIAILTGDILPFIHTMECQEFSLLCLPDEFRLNDLESLIYSASSDAEIRDRLFDMGAVIVSIPDGFVFTAVSRLHDIQRYFSSSW
jgi:hypothetical protein